MPVERSGNSDGNTVVLVFGVPQGTFQNEKFLKFSGGLKEFQAPVEV
jgi:hypothetical protein